VYCIMGNTISYPVSIDQSSHLCNTLIQNPKCLFLSDHKPAYVKLRWWFIGLKHVRFWIHIMLLQGGGGNSHTFVSCFINCIFLWWVISNTEVIMTCFKALGQYLSRKTPSRSYTKERKLHHFTVWDILHVGSSSQTGWIQINVP